MYISTAMWQTITEKILKKTYVLAILSVFVPAKHKQTLPVGGM